MQASERNAQAKTGAGHQQQFALSNKEKRFQKAGKPTGGKSREDDCSSHDKLPKPIDDLVEGGSPKRFKRPKMASDIVAR